MRIRVSVRSSGIVGREDEGEGVGVPYGVKESGQK